MRRKGQRTRFHPFADKLRPEDLMRGCWTIGKTKTFSLQFESLKLQYCFTELLGGWRECSLPLVGRWVEAKVQEFKVFKARKPEPSL